MPKRGESASPAQRAALKRGQKKRAELLAAGGEETASDRWAALLSGQITVRDLDDEEIKKMRVRGKGGTFGGRSRTLPSHLAAAMAAENRRRAKEGLDKLLNTAVQTLQQIMTDPDADTKERRDVAKYIIDRGLGKAEATVNLNTTVSDWTQLTQDALSVNRELNEIIDASPDE